MATDGTHISLSKELSKENYKTTKKNTYVDALVNGLYDIYNDSIIDLHLSNTKNERKSYCRQFSSLKENDIVIHFKLCL